MHGEYKKSNMDTWNEIAPKYHKRWAGKMRGPLQSTEKLVRDVGVKGGDRVLDVACGTGLVTRMLAGAVGDSGHVVGADASMSAIRIAQRLRRRNVSFLNMDAENMAFAGRFDVVTCQFALFFFPDAPRALGCMRRNLKRPGGRIGIAVHGGRDKVPYYKAVLDAAAEFIPDYVPEGTPQLDRYSTKKGLRNVVREAGFSNVAVREYAFSYSPGTFGSYWGEYQRYVAKPLRAKIDALGRRRKAEFREEIRRNTAAYTDRGNGAITFPWHVLVLTAMR